MIILYVLVPLGLLLCALAVWAFFWAVNSGQFDDLELAAGSPLDEGHDGDPASRIAAGGGPDG
ncbi:MAG: cbb3-type cytochrome oxidase assembly protein CcoS [Gammaproteobacteria bacterium]|nr:cbb3-type cytochrome oxidase assembly protein CcoS [Gammaproteobacteria bacterium]